VSIYNDMKSIHSLARSDVSFSDVSQSEYPQLTNVARYDSPFELFLTWPLLNGPSFIVHSLYRDPAGTAIGIQITFPLSLPPVPAIIGV